MDISDNSIFSNGQSEEARAEAAKALAQALTINKSITELNIASNFMRAEQAQIIAPAIGPNGALETITFGDKQAATMKTAMTEADLSGKELGASGAIIAAAFLPKCQ